MTAIHFNQALIEKYSGEAPRYTSYPTAMDFSQKFNMDDYMTCVAESNEVLVPNPLSIYIHIPFCNTVCFYCACNKVTTGDWARAEEYVDYLEKEIKMRSEMFDRDRMVLQLHFGGGTPTFLSTEQLGRIIQALHSNFSLSQSEERDFSIEIDPRTVSTANLKDLRELGFNRVSFGIQDFNDQVQRAVNRVQSEEHIRDLVEAAKKLGYRSINVDLIYGLPHQTVTSFDETISKTLALKPGRISLFNYAHLPERFKPQRRIKSTDLPDAETKMSIYRNSIHELMQGGYNFIGMDHFALPEDDLTVAQRQNKLHRNFQGYTTNADCDLIAFGASSIGFINDCYAQNYHKIEDYYAALDKGLLPVCRGKKLTLDDKIRRYVIMQLVCNFYLNITIFEDRFGVNFQEYFEDELGELARMQQDSLLIMNQSVIKITPSGRLVIRAVAKVFDRYRAAEKEVGFSRII